MIARLADSFIGGVELLEAEGRLARHYAVRVASGVAALVGAGAVAIAGLLALLAGVTCILVPRLGVGGALMLVGGAVLLCGGGVAAFIYGRLRSEQRTQPANLQRGEG